MSTHENSFFLRWTIIPGFYSRAQTISYVKDYTVDYSVHTVLSCNLWTLEVYLLNIGHSSLITYMTHFSPSFSKTFHKEMYSVERCLDSKWDVIMLFWNHSSSLPWDFIVPLQSLLKYLGLHWLLQINLRSINALSIWCIQTGHLRRKSKNYFWKIFLLYIAYTNMYFFS